MKIKDQKKIPKEIEELSLFEQKCFFHSLREEAEIKYNKIYSDYRKQWKSLNSIYKQIFIEIDSSQKDYVGFFIFFKKNS